MAQKHGLGRGLEALINDGIPSPDAPSAPSPGLLEVPLTSVHVAPWQPRQSFDDATMQELIDSVRERGVLQPLLVRRRQDGYELIAGERRLRAAGAAGLTRAPVIVVDASDEDALAVALIENLQRQDLNAIEEAEGYHVLSDKFSLTQEEIARRVGKARATVANALRLLNLPPPVRAMVADGRLSAGHAKVLTGLEIAAEQLHLAERVVHDDLSVRQLEQAIERARRVPRKPRAARTDLPPDHITYLIDRLHQHFGTAVRVSPSRTYANGKKAKGTIEIDFYSNEDLDRVLTMLGLADEET